MEPILYRIEEFEGPLDVLLSLVEKHKMNIEDVPIDLLCAQYLAWIEEVKGQKLEVACEFITMASELMLIKSRMLLPRVDNAAEDPRKPLIDALLEYRRAKLAAAELSDLFGFYGGRMVKEQDDISPDRTYVADHNADLLRAALTRVLTETRMTEKTVQTSFAPIVNAPRIPVGTILKNLVSALRQKPVWLDGFFREADGRSDLVARFIAVLEILKSHLAALEEHPGEDGVTDMREHLSLRLTATEEEIAAATLESDFY